MPTTYIYVFKWFKVSKTTKKTSEVCKKPVLQNKTGGCYGIVYITYHYTLRPPATECKQLLYYIGNKALKNRICLWNFLWVGVEWGCAGVDYLAKSLNQIN